MDFSNCSNGCSGREAFDEAEFVGRHQAFDVEQDQHAVVDGADSEQEFGVEASAREAIIGLVDAQGHPLEVGGGVVLNGVDGELLVGFDGEVFAIGLEPQNEIRVFYPDGRTCTASFDYMDEPGTLTEVRGVPCL